MRNSHIHLARLVISLGYEGFQRLGETFVPGLVGLDDLSRPFIEDENVIVLIKNPRLQIPELLLAQ